MEVMYKRIAKLGIPLFFLLPLGGFLTALCNIRSKASALVYIAFAALLGYAISFSNDSADSFRYAVAFTTFDNTLDYNTLLQLYRNGELRDLYRVLLFYFTSIFTNNPKVMFAFAGLVYGIFSYLILKLFVQIRGAKLDRYVFILALILFTYISLINVNGFRFNTGAVLFCYAAYKFIIERRTVWLIGILVTPLFHYGFILIAPLFIFYRFVHPFLYDQEGVRPALFYLFVASFIASWLLGTNSINLGFLTETDALSGAVGSRLSYVNNEATAELYESRKDSSFFLSVKTYFSYGIRIYIFIAILFLNKLLKRMTGTGKVEYTNFFAFILFFYSFAFIATSFPSGARFMDMAHVLFLLFMGKIYGVYKEKPMRMLILWALPVFAFNIAFVNGLLPAMILTPTFWYGNVFWTIFEGLNFYI